MAYALVTGNGEFGDATLHGLNFHAWYAVCGDVSGCPAPLIQSF